MKRNMMSLCHKNPQEILLLCTRIYICVCVQEERASAAGLLEHLSMKLERKDLIVVVFVSFSR